jgi:hypothetical protein
MSNGSYETETFESFLQDLVAAFTRRRGVRVAPDALNELISVSSRALQTEREGVVLETRRDEIQRNIERLMDFIATQIDAADTRSGVITYRTFTGGLAEFCRRHPDAYPLCPYP